MAVITAGIMGKKENDPSRRREASASSHPAREEERVWAGLRGEVEAATEARDDNGGVGPGDRSPALLAAAERAAGAVAELILVFLADLARERQEPGQRKPEPGR